MGISVTISKVLLVSSVNSISPANYLIDAFKRKNIEIRVISDVKNSKVDFVSVGAFDVKSYLNLSHYKPDLLLFVEGGEMGIFPVNFNDIKCYKAWWGIDTHNDYAKHLAISALFDHTFLAQKQFVERMRLAGIISVSWLPLAYPDNNSIPSNSLYDISYVGSSNWELYPARGSLLELIKEEFDNTCFKECAPAEMFEIYENSKFVFNYSLKNDLNMRIFEAAGSGAIVLTNIIEDNGFNDIFTNKENILTYANFDDLKLLLHGLLKDSKKINQISTNALELIRSFHKYSDRALVILEFPYMSKEVLNFELLSSVALLKLGQISDSLLAYLESIVNSNFGKRNKLIVKLIAPLIQISILIARKIEKLAWINRKTKW